MCFQCAESSKMYHRETRKFLKQMGLCPRCGKNKLFGDEKECPECVAMMYALNLKSMERRNFNAKEYYKKDIQRLKDKGICRRCRKRSVAEGHTHCAACLAKHREEGRKRRAYIKNKGISRSERPNYGLCYRCGANLDTDKRLCSKCSGKAISNLPKVRAENKLWKADNQRVFQKRGE